MTVLRSLRSQARLWEEQSQVISDRELLLRRTGAFITFQCSDERTAYLAGIAMTLIDQCGKHSCDAPQLRNALADRCQLPRAELLRLAAVPAVFERKQIGNFLEAEAQCR